MKYCIIIVVFLSISSAYVASGSLLDEYKDWISSNGKTTSNENFTTKSFATWTSRKLEVDNHNVRFAQGLETYQKGINRFSDIPTDEFISRYTGAKPPANGRMLDEQESEMLFSSQSVGRQAASFDWRTKGAVTPVKNQGACGSCWAFAVVASIETQYFKKTNRLLALSEQNLVDCDTLDNGCNGGWPTNTYTHIIRAGGINTMAAYPYKGVKSTCRFSSTTGFGTKITKYATVNSGTASEARLQAAVANNGPVVVAIQVTSSLQNYKSGIFYDGTCSTSKDKVNHAVTVVGYGTTGGVDFWIVKNSWSNEWGEAGYIRMARNRNNNCNIATWNWYPIL